MRLLGVIFVLSFVQNAVAQNAQYAYLVTFTDKDPTSFSLNSPQAYLSARSIARRAKYNISIDSTDLPVIASYVDSILHVTQGVLHVTSRWQNSAVILIPDTTTVSSLLNIAFIKSIKQVGRYATGLHLRPSGTQDSAQENKPTGFDQNYYGVAWNQIHLCEGEYLHNAGYRGENMLIAVLDMGFGGVDTVGAFDSLRQENRLIDTKNFVLNTSAVFGYADHGTNVLSTMASLIPETHVGTAPKAIYALYISEDATSEQIIEESNFLAACERADSIGADLITTSLGYNTFDNNINNHVFSDFDGNTTVAAKAANAAVRKGIFVLASAGNEGSTSWQKILTPGDADSAMTIGAVNTAKTIASFSGYGPNAANVIKPDVCGMGVTAAVIADNGNVTTNSGTSISTPEIAGLTACFMEANPQLKPLEIRALISASCDSFTAPSTHRGYGVPDFQKAMGATTAVANVPSKSIDAFVVSPNPSSEFVTIKGDGKLVYAIMDLQGRTLLQGQTISGRNIFVGKLSAGIYLMKVHNDKYFQSFKINIR